MSSDVVELERVADGLPDGWRDACLGDLCRINIGGTPPRHKPEYWAADGGGHPWVAISDLRQPVIAGTKERITDAGVANSNVKLVKAGTIMMSFKLTIGRVAVAGIDLFTNEAIAAFVPVTGIDTSFLPYWLVRIVEDADTDQAIKGATLNKQKLAILSGPLPPLDEQRRIAEVLRSVDEALHAARQVAEQCEQVLRLELDSIVAKLLADGVAKVKLGEVAKVKGGKRLPKGSEYSDEPTTNPYIRVTDWRDYEIRTDAIRFISDDVAQSIWRYTISKCDLFISIAGSVGLVAAVPDELDGAYLTENAAKICINDPSALNATFLVAVLRSRALAEQISRHKGVGGGVPKLALFRIEDLDIPLPPPAVQAEIAHSYTSVRTSAEAARNAADQLERTRTEVMSDLLSGRVRVPE